MRLPSSAHSFPLVLRDVADSSSSSGDNSSNNTQRMARGWDIAAYVVLGLALLVAACGGRGIYQQHTARRRQRQGKRHGNKLLTEADLDVLPKFKLTLDSLVDIKRAHARRRHLVAPRAAPPREIALPQPAYLHAVPSYSSTASLPEIGRGSTSASPINPDIQRQSIDGTILALSEHTALADNIDDAESRYTPTETGPPSCVICLEEYVVDDEVRVLPCGHVFHDQCITPWLLRPKSKFHECPMCKTPCFPEEAARKAKEEAAGLSSDDDQRNAPTNLVSVF